MEDIQNTSDQRGISLSYAGVCHLKSPFIFQDLAPTLDNRLGIKTLLPLSTVGEFSLAVSLSQTQRGVHMSRFEVILQQMLQQAVSANSLRDLKENIRQSQLSEKSLVSMQFPYFYHMSAPVSGVPGLASAQVLLTQDLYGFQECLQVIVPVMNLCPCSKAISKYGAHSQRSEISITLSSWDLSVLDCIFVATRVASSPLFPVLKREDEKFVTETSYETPRFVEDLVREALIVLGSFLPSTVRGVVRAESFESIHQHNAWAEGWVLS